jgi:hypothetical protein
MENLEKYSITEILNFIDQLTENEKFYISFDNVYSSYVLSKKDKMYFLDMHRSKENYFDKKLFYQQIRKKYFVQINEIKVTI